jgi:hypothetical protein
MATLNTDKNVREIIPQSIVLYGGYQYRVISIETREDGKTDVTLQTFASKKQTVLTFPPYYSSMYVYTEPDQLPTPPPAPTTSPPDFAKRMSGVSM